MPNEPAAKPPEEVDLLDVLHHFVDEAGDPAIFNAKGNVIVESLGCSRFFFLGVLEVNEPAQLAAQLVALRTRLLADPYFAGVESFKPERKKTALHFHAKDDLPEVRREVFKLLANQGNAVRFHAVVCDKKQVVAEEVAKHAASGLTRYRYNPDSLYDRLCTELFAGLHRFADEHRLCAAKRGNKVRNEAFTASITKAETLFEQNFGFRRKAAWKVITSDPDREVCLQAVDYYLWALQRFYEVRFDGRTGRMVVDATGKPAREDRYLSVLWPQFTEVLDLHFGPAQGTRWRRDNPLTLEARFPPSGKEKPRI